MKPQLRLYVLVSLVSIAIAVGGIWLFYALSNQEPGHIFPATINRDCAPWDGSAFTISFHYDAATTITISIWQAPSLVFPVTFSFPDETMRIGMAYAVQELDPLEQLTGKVWFPRLEEGESVEGRFSFTSERGEHFSGTFIAEWGNVVAYCG